MIRQNSSSHPDEVSHVGPAAGRGPAAEAGVITMGLLLGQTVIDIHLTHFTIAIQGCLFIAMQLHSCHKFSGLAQL